MLEGLRAYQRNDYETALQEFLPLAESASGVIRLTVYDYSSKPPRPIAERLVYRRDNRKLNDGRTSASR